MSEANTKTGGAVLAITTATDPGKVRTRNEDSCAVDESIGLAVVADGIGGHAGGDIASAVTVKTVVAAVRRRLLSIAGDQINSISISKAELDLIVRAALIDAHAAVLDEMHAGNGPRGMASTVVALLVHGGVGAIGWVGDSPAYVIRGGHMGSPITRSHDLANDGVVPKLSPGGSKKPLTRVIGGGADLFLPEVTTFDVQSGDTYLLCSDGLTDMLGGGQIESMLRRRGDSPGAMAAALVDAANRAGGEDNITVALARVLSAPPSREATGAGVPAQAPQISSRRHYALAAVASLAAAIVGAAGAWYFKPGPVAPAVAPLPAPASASAPAAAPRTPPALLDAPTPAPVPAPAPVPVPMPASEPAPTHVPAPVTEPVAASETAPPAALESLREAQPAASAKGAPLGGKTSKPKKTRKPKNYAV